VQTDTAQICDEWKMYALDNIDISSDHDAEESSIRIDRYWNHVLKLKDNQ